MSIYAPSSVISLASFEMDSSLPRLITHFVLNFSSTTSTTLTVYSDTDWVGCPDDWKFTIGFCIFFGSHLISQSSKKQSTVARSLTETEYKSVANTTCELLWLQPLLQELCIFLPKPPTLLCDNLRATYVFVNPVLHSRTKHKELDYHFVRESDHWNSRHNNWQNYDSEYSWVVNIRQ